MSALQALCLPQWCGRTVAVLASGPSMSQAVADAVRHLPRIVVNTTYKLAPDAEVLYACDVAWWKQNLDAQRFAGLKVAVEPIKDTLPAEGFPRGVLVLSNSGYRGFDPRPGFIRTHANSGAQAIQVAVHAGAARVLLLGFDMRGGHWHGDHPAPLKTLLPEKMKTCVETMRELAFGIAATGCSVINCTPGSALDCFPFEPLEDVLHIAEIAA